MFGSDKAERRLAALLQTLSQDMSAGFSRLERLVSKMPSRQDLDQAKADLQKAISDAAQRVSADIQQLRDELANGNPVTDQDLADLQADIKGVGQIDPANPPTP